MVALAERADRWKKKPSNAKKGEESRATSNNDEQDVSSFLRALNVRAETVMGGMQTVVARERPPEEIEDGTEDWEDMEPEVLKHSEQMKAIKNVQLLTIANSVR
jgi:hypothetical protein